MIVYGMNAAADGSSFRPQPRVLATTPTTVTSAGPGRQERGRRRLPRQDIEPDAAADRILARRPEPQRRFVDERHPIATPHFVGCEGPAAPQRDAERAQVVGTDQGHRHGALLQLGVAFDGEA